MPIFHKDGKNVLFIHVPKTGGSTIDKVFRRSGYELSYVDGKMGAGTLNHVRRCTPQHMHGDMLRQIFAIRRFDVIFMIVREPVARFSSEYLWRNRDLDIDVSARAVEEWGRDMFDRLAKDSYAFDNHLRPQADFWVNGAQVYRFEDGLDSVVDDLNENHGLDLKPDLPHERDGKEHSGFSSRDVNISDSLNASIHRVYRGDFEQFGYAPTGASTVIRRGLQLPRRALVRGARKVLRTWG